jgi:hypothetical protein
MRSVINEQLLEEVEVLRSIYDSQLQLDDNVINEHGTEITCIRYRDPERNILLTFHIPVNTYPNDNPTALQIDISSIDSKVHGYDLIVDCIARTLSDCVGEVVVFRVVEAVKEALETTISPSCAEPLERDSCEVAVCESGPPIMIDCHLNIIHGPSTSELKSSFQSHLAHVTSMEEVNLFRAKVLEDKKVRKNYFKPD